MAEPRDGRDLGAPLDAHQLDEQALETYLTAHIPGFSGEIRVQQFRGGQSNPTYLIDAQSGSYVLRKKPPGKLLPSAHAVDREYRVLSALQDTAVPVPPTHVLCEDDSVIGQMFYVMDYVPGRVIADSDLPGCAPAERTAMYSSMIEVLGALHAVDYATVGLETFGKPSGFITRQVARWSGQYAASKIEECPAMDELAAWLVENDPQDERSSIVHGDYRPGNVIFENDEPVVAAVLDWELATIGHPFADLGYLLMPYHYPAESFQSGLKDRDLQKLGIPDEAEVIRLYAHSANLEELPDTTYYVAFSMFRLAAILSGVLRRGLDGIAADPGAIAQGRRYSALANSALTLLPG